MKYDEWEKVIGEENLKYCEWRAMSWEPDGTLE